MTKDLSYERMSSHMKACVTKSDKQAFISSLICSLFGYLYFGLNMLPNSDGLRSFNSFNSYLNIFLGRWAMAAFGYEQKLLAPWAQLFLTIIIFALCTVFIVRIFSITRLCAIVGVAASLVLNLSVIATMLYIHMIGIFYFGLLLCILGIYITERYKYGVLAGVCLVSISTGIYQMFFCFAVAVFTVRLLQKILKNQDTNKSLLSYVLKYVILLSASFALYMLVNKIVLYTLDLSMPSYMGLDTMGQITAEQMVGGAKEAYIYFAIYFKRILDFCGVFPFIIAVLILAAIPTVSLIDLIDDKKRPIFQIISGVFLVMAFPLAVNAIYLTTSKYSNLHDVVRYSMCFIFICAIVLIEEISNKQGQKRNSPYAENESKSRTQRALSLVTVLFTWIVLIGPIIIGFRWGIVANETATVVEMRHKNAYALCIRLVDRIEQHPEFNSSDTPVVICFNRGIPNNTNHNMYYEKITGLERSEYAFISHSDTMYYYIRDFIGMRYNAMFDDDSPGDSRRRRLDALKREIEQKDVYQQMPSFPDKNSIAMIDGVLVVKISESQ